MHSNGTGTGKNKSLEYRDFQDSSSTAGPAFTQFQNTIATLPVSRQGCGLGLDVSVSRPNNVSASVSSWMDWQMPRYWSQSWNRRFRFLVSDSGHLGLMHIPAYGCL